MFVNIYKSLFFFFKTVNWRVLHLWSFLIFPFSLIPFSGFLFPLFVQFVSIRFLRAFVCVLKVLFVPFTKSLGLVSQWSPRGSVTLTAITFPDAEGEKTRAFRDLRTSQRASSSLAHFARANSTQNLLIVCVCVQFASVVCETGNACWSASSRGDWREEGVLSLGARFPRCQLRVASRLCNCGEPAASPLLVPLGGFCAAPSHTGGLPSLVRSDALLPPLARLAMRRLQDQGTAPPSSSCPEEAPLLPSLVRGNLSLWRRRNRKSRRDVLLFCPQTPFRFIFGERHYSSRRPVQVSLAMLFWGSWGED